MSILFLFFLIIFIRVFKRVLSSYVVYQDARTDIRLSANQLVVDISMVVIDRCFQTLNTRIVIFTYPFGRQARYNISKRFNSIFLGS